MEIKLVNISDSFKKSFYTKAVKIWKTIWEEDVPDFDCSKALDDEYERADELKEHIRKQEFVKSKRIFVSLIIFFIVYFIGNCLFSSCEYLIKTNSYLSSFNKPVSIYLGAKRATPAPRTITATLNNGDIYVYNDDCHIAVYYLIAFNKCLPKTGFFYYVTLPIRTTVNNIEDFFIQKYDYRMAEIYKKDKNKFVKIKGYRKYPEEIGGIKLVDSQNNVYNFLHKSKLKEQYKKLDKYNFIKNEFETVDNPFLFRDMTLYAKYKNKYLVSEAETKGGFSRFDIKPQIYNKKLYLLNPDTMKLEKFAELAQLPEEGFYAKNVKVLKNGKIIIPFYRINEEIVSSDTSFYKEYMKYINIDHIEIYLPEQNRFIAEYNDEILKENYFQFELANGDVMYINEDSTWIFNNKENRFEKANDILTEKNKYFAEKINKALLEEIGIKLEDRLYKTVKYIELSPTKYLLTCDINARASEKMCKHTVLVDYYNIPAQKGPDFINGHNLASIERIDDKRLMVIGGFDDEKQIPSKRVQIIQMNK